MSLKTSTDAKAALNQRYKELKNYIKNLKEDRKNYCINDYADYDLGVIIHDLEVITIRLQKDVIHHGE